MFFLLLQSYLLRAHCVSGTILILLHTFFIAIISVVSPILQIKKGIRRFLGHGVRPGRSQARQPDSKPVFCHFHDWFSNLALR